MHNKSLVVAYFNQIVHSLDRMLRPREMAQWVQLLACKCEGLASDPQNPQSQLV